MFLCPCKTRYRHIKVVFLSLCHMLPHTLESHCPCKTYHEQLEIYYFLQTLCVNIDCGGGWGGGDNIFARHTANSFSSKRFPQTITCGINDRVDCKTSIFRQKKPNKPKLKQNNRKAIKTQQNSRCAVNKIISHVILNAFRQRSFQKQINNSSRSTE